MKKIIVIFSVFVISCNTTVQITVSNEEIYKAQQRNSAITFSNLEDGKKLYYSHCKSCHRLYKTTDYNTAEWNSILPAMIAKAQLKEETEMKKISDYIKSTCK